MAADTSAAGAGGYESGELEGNAPAYEYISGELQPHAVAIHELAADPRNARGHEREDLEALVASLRTFGQQKPIVYWRRPDGVRQIVAGEGTWRAMQALSAAFIAAVEFEGTEAEARAYGVADNRTGELSRWRDDALAETLADLRAEREDLVAATGFEADDVDARLERLEAERAARLERLEAEAGRGDDAGEDGADGADERAGDSAGPGPGGAVGASAATASAFTGEPEVVEDPEDSEIERARNLPALVKDGEVYELGGSLLVCGDVTAPEVSALAAVLGPVSCVVTDPPYAIYGSSSGLAADITDDKIVRPFFEAVLRATSNALKTFGHAYVFCDWRSWPAWWEMAKRTALTAKNLIVWDKGGGGLGASYANTYELVGFFSALPPQRVMKGDNPRGQRTVYAPNLVRFNRASGKERLHNAAKPLGLCRTLIENSTDPGEVVVDWFAGSGTTLLAALASGRRCVTFEIDPRWCDVVVHRYHGKTGTEARKLGTVSDGLEALAAKLAELEQPAAVAS